MSSVGELTCVGLNHQTAPVEVRERVTFAENKLTHALHALVGQHQMREAAILSTCNRTEVYARGSSDHTGQALTQFLHEFHGLPGTLLSPHLYCHTGSSALKQLFRVASALDSLVVGEPQILGQIKDAYQAAQEAGTAGPLLNRVFQHAFLAAKRVRSETKIGNNAVTVSFAAVELAQKVFGNLKGLNCLLIGAGEMSELAAQHFQRRGAKLVIANRSLAHAEELATRSGATAESLARLEELLNTADVIVASTASPHFLVGPSEVRRSMKRRRYRPMFIVDIAVPRNVDPAVAKIDGVYLYDIDDLGSVVLGNIAQRQMEMGAAEQIIEEELHQLAKQFRLKQLGPLLATMKQHGEDVAKEELEKVFTALGEGVSSEHKQHIAKMAHALASKLLHPSIHLVKDQILRVDDGEALLAQARELWKK